jgi:hypothetical protein
MRPRIPAAAALVAAAVFASCVSISGRRRGEASPAEQQAAAKANAICFDCHIDFKGEELAAVHVKGGISCARCHGASKPHMDDEVRRTPADVTFRGKAMPVFCHTCHDPEKHMAIEPHQLAATTTADTGKPKSCTECHGDHKLVELE